MVAARHVSVCCVASKYRSTAHCVSEIFKNEGFLAFYKGVGPRLTRVCLEVGITMSMYGEIVKAVSRIVNTAESFITCSNNINYTFFFHQF
mmetsp:Transcript_17944/g.40753  ORF Transcript_17944/g.40753 Transcript_17944/m.40753 type:complete len:91 (+) Transcript_17944:57-329(+)